MTAEHGNFLNNIERPIRFMSNGNALFDGVDESLLGLESPQHVDKVFDVSWQRLEVVQMCYRALQSADDAHNWIPESKAKREARRRMITERAQEAERLEYIVESVGSAAFGLWLKALEDNDI